MALESATYISDLNTSNPTSTDVLSQADDHLRLIKAAIKTTFPNINGAVTATPAALNAATSFDMPSGSIIVYAGSSAPTGFLFCDGSAVSRSTYSALFGIISTSYGVGDGSSTFNLPDIRGRVVAGKEASASLLTSAVGGLNGNTLGNTGGAQGVTLTSAQSGLPAHNHSLTMNSHTHSFTSPPHSHTVTGVIGSGLGAGVVAGGGTVTTSSVAVTGTNSTVTTTGTIGNNSAANASSAHTNVQPTIILNYCIKT
tara:strand:+ start:56 stop:820 length:765 start_codon:yes stop_codon:yes gene_type:complete